MATPLIVADFSTQLSSAISVGSTSFTILSVIDDDGVSLVNGLYYFTVDSGSSNKEYLTGTLNVGTKTVSAVKTVSRQGVETSGAIKAHRVGADIKITDFATYKKYIDETSIAGAPNATTTLQGLVEVATQAEVNAGTAIGGTGAPLSVAPDTLAVYVASQNFVLTGCIFPYASSTPPTGYLNCDGAAVSRTTYANLFTVTSTNYGAGDGSTTFNLPDLKSRFPLGYSASAPTKVFTFASRASNVITVTGASDNANNELQTGQAVLYSAPSGAMTGLTHNTTYFLVKTGNLTFSLATSVANANAGTVIALSSDGTGSQTFTATYTARAIGEYGGEENHALTDAEMPSHTHSNAPGSGVASGGGSGAFNNAGVTGSAGSDTVHNNMPLFTVVNYIIKT